MCYSFRNRCSLFAVVPALALALLACGGGGSGGSGGTAGGTTSGSTHPSTKTYTDVGNNIASLGQSAVAVSFWSFGAKQSNHGLPYFDARLNLYGKSFLSPDKIEEFLYSDSAATQAAGSMLYTIVDAALSLNGPITVTAGPYSGLTGNYSQVEQQGANNAIVGLTGSISYSMPNIGTTDVQDSIATQSSGAYTGTSTVSVALNSGYTQTQKVTYNADGSYTFTTTDTVSLKGSVTVAADSSSTGTFSGADPGLPATFSLDVSGGGSVKFADGSTRTVSAWTMQ